MVFFDTCIWIELLAVRTPQKQHEIRQALEASRVLVDVLNRQEQIVSCKEQLVEIIKAIEKVKLKEVNIVRKQNSLPGIGNLKEFRGTSEFRQT